MYPSLSKIVFPPHIEYVILDDNLCIQATSAGMAQWVEFSDRLTLGEDIRVAFPELIGVEDALVAVREGRQACFELKGIGRDRSAQSLIYLDLYFLQYQSNVIAGNQLIAFLEDVTDKMLLEQKLVQATNESGLLLDNLRQSQNYISQIVTFMADALLITDRFGTIKMVNRAAQNLFGYSEIELLNQPISALLGENNVCQPTIEPLNLTALETNCRRKSGEKIIVAFSCSAISTYFPESPENIGLIQDIIYIGRDVTHQKRAQNRLIAQYKTTRILSESTTLTDAIPQLLQALCQSLNWDIGEFWLLQQTGLERSFLSCQEIWIENSLQVPKFIKTTQEMHFNYGEGLPGRIWQTGLPIWIDRIAEDANCWRKQVAQQEGICAALGCPIQLDREILGVAIFWSCDRQPLEEELLQTLAVIGTQIAQFIKRKQAQ